MKSKLISLLAIIFVVVITLEQSSGRHAHYPRHGGHLHEGRSGMMPQPGMGHHRPGPGHSNGYFRQVSVSPGYRSEHTVHHGRPRGHLQATRALGSGFGHGY